MKKDNGVSLMSLVVTIVVMLILASVSIYYGTRKNIETAYATDMYTEIKNVSEATQQRFLTNRIDANRYPYVGTKLTDTNPKKIKMQKNGVETEMEYGDGWYLLTPEHSLELNLENVENEYIINYLTGEVVSLKPIVFEDNEYYTFNELNSVMGEDDTPISDSSYNLAQGVNKPVLVPGMIPVRNAAGKWLITNEEDDRWYDYSADNNVWANVMLLDEITIPGYSNEDIRNASLADLEGRQVETTGSMFVWMPRHTTNGTGVVYSKLLHDYTENGYTLPDSFVKDSNDVTGIWISKYDSDYSE